jgi:phosphoribosylformylglycinamidine (FGAM) synthase-like enzyme
MAVMEDVSRVISMDCKQAGNLIYIAGTTYDELGGSHYYAVRGAMGNKVPRVNPEKGKKLMDSLSVATEKGMVKACHDLSEGGIGVAAAEMAFAGGLGMIIHLDKVPLGENIARNDSILFSESNTRFLVEVTPEDKERFEKAMKGIDLAAVGEVTKGDKLEVYGVNGKKIVAAPLAELKEAWQKPLGW